ncbi:MAG: tetrahydromethanopterin S-methyltransferase subunit D [Candidatus Methanospirareceae archaeon]
MEPITTLLIILVCIIIGGMCGSLGVHLLPVGGAPAAMATATGIATGCVMLMTGSAVTGLFTASTVAAFWESSPNVLLVALSGGVGAMLMIGFTMLIANLIYIFGAGIVPVSGRAAVDPITKESQTEYKTPRTDGHGVPNVCYYSGMLGGLIGGFGGALIYVILLSKDYAGFSVETAVLVALGIFIANAIMAAYNIGGTIEGFHDPKFKERIVTGLSCAFIISLMCGVLVLIAIETGTLGAGGVI